MELIYSHCSNTETVCIVNTLAINGGKPAITNPLPTISDVSGRSIGLEDLSYLREVIESGNLSFLGGEKNSLFEKKFAALHKRNHAVAVSSGTAALHTGIIYLNQNLVMKLSCRLLQI